MEKSKKTNMRKKGPDKVDKDKDVLIRKMEAGATAAQKGDFLTAVTLNTEAIGLDPKNHVLYSNRSAAYHRLGQLEDALKDARTAKKLMPTWSKAYYREGIALQSMGRHAEALAALATGLTQDSKNEQLLASMVETASNSAMKVKIVPILEQLEQLSLDKSAFVITSVVGQELLSAGCFAISIVVLEAALQIGTSSQKLKGSVFSALCSAHWALGNIDEAIHCMQEDLDVAVGLGDKEGECRGHGNLGSGYFSKGCYKEALDHHQQQLKLAMSLRSRKVAAQALSCLGHIYMASGDYSKALESHKQCVLLVRQNKDRLNEARETGNVGCVYLAMGQFDKAVECHQEHLTIARKIKNKVEEARAFSNLGSAYHYTRDYGKAMEFHRQVLNISESLGDKTLEARAYAGLGHAMRCKGDSAQAKFYHEKQLDNALQTKDRVGEGRACANLGIIFQNFGDYDAALKLHKSHLNVAKKLGDRASQGRAYGNIGNAYSAMEEYNLAVRFHKQMLSISKEVSDKHSEASTHGNLAVAYQALNIPKEALHHYEMHLTLSKQLHLIASEARANSNLGNFHSGQGNFKDALPYYEQYLSLSQELKDSEGESQACHKLGYAHYCLHNYKEAIRYYEQDLALAKQLEDKLGMARAYCNLGQAHKAIQNYSDALECQKEFLSLSMALKNLSAQFRSFGNIGDIYLKMNEPAQSVQMYNKQLQLAKCMKDKKNEALALRNLGYAQKYVKDYGKALGFHNQELMIWNDLEDTKGQCVAHGCLGNISMLQGEYIKAVKCYEEQLDCSRDHYNCAVEAQAYGNLGIAKMNMTEFDEAIGMFEQQLAMLEQVQTKYVMQDRGNAYGNLGDCYTAIGDFEEAVRCYEQFLVIAQTTDIPKDIGRAYHGLGDAHRALGNLQQSLVCFEKRLFIAHDLDNLTMKASAHGELGCLHSLLGNYEQAISCLQNQLELARELEDSAMQSDAACGLGGVYQQMGEHEKAIEYHKIDLENAKTQQDNFNLCRAYGNLGLSHESLGQFEQAIEFQELHLTLAGEVKDKSSKTLALCSLGRIYHAMGKYNRSIQYLQQGLLLAEELQRREEEAKIRHRLGLAFWGQGQLQDAQNQLFKAAELFEMIRRGAHANSEYKLSLFDLQTACYQALQRVLVSLGMHQEALIVAERGRTRAFVDLLLERQTVGDSWYSDLDSSPVTLEQILDIVGKQKASVLYYSLAAGYLYSWYLTPDKGIVKFHERSIADLEHNSDPEDAQSLHSLNVSSVSVLDQYVGHVRESLGVDAHMSNTLSRSGKLGVSLSETESDADEHWQHHLEEVGDKLNSENDRIGFLRMVNRNHILNASSYSISSLLSLSSSLNGTGLSRIGSTRSGRSHNGQPPLSALYELLIQPMEDVLEAKKNSKQDLVLVLQGDLYLVPFALLRPTQPSLCLYERFNLLVVPSVRALEASQNMSKHNQYNPECSGTVVIGQPKIPPSIAKQWDWGEIPTAENECRFVSELMGCSSLTGSSATKDNVLQRMLKSEVIHFATHISWKLAAIVLSSPDVPVTSHTDINGKRVECMDLDSSCSDISSLMDSPALSEFLLSAADVLNIKVAAKLVVLSSVHSEDRAGRINTDGVVGLTRAFLAAGAQCVLFSLWPVPAMAARLLLKSFYTALLQGSPCSAALSDAMKTVQSTRQFAHPSNWASWVLVGSDVYLSSKVSLMGHALCEILKTPDRAREAMRVVLHLVEKSLHRIQHGQRNAMYTTQQSIQNKVAGVNGWRELLESVGFRFEAAVNELPASVFFPTADPGDRLTQCSASLQALLGLPIPTLGALAKLLDQPEAGEALTAVLKEVNTRVSQESSVKTTVDVRLWKVDGCHEFLASIGFDLVDIGKDEVTVKAGKQAGRRNLQFAFQALIALFDTQQAPRSLLIDSSSSMESLCSTGSATSTSNFSKGSTPPTSPLSNKKRSIFNPAEVDKLPSARTRHHGGTVSKTVSGSKSMPDLSIQLSHLSKIRTKYCSGSGSDDNSAEEAGLAKVLSVDIGEAALKEGSSSECASPQGQSRPRPKHSLFERGGQVKTYFPQPPRMYSTSTSDSEEAAVKERKENLSNFSQSRNSLASNSSTLTARSSNGSALRRNRARSSALSVKSSASDRTLTEEPPSRRNSIPNVGTRKPDSTRSSSSRRGKEEEYSLPESTMTSTPMTAATNKAVEKKKVDVSKDAEDGKISSEIYSQTSKKSRSQSTKLDDLELLPTDPTAIAKRILAETHGERLALENFQKNSLKELREKQTEKHDTKKERSENKIDFSAADRTDFLLNNILKTNSRRTESNESLQNDNSAKAAKNMLQESPTRKVRDEIMEIQLNKLNKNVADSSGRGLVVASSGRGLVVASSGRGLVVARTEGNTAVQETRFETQNTTVMIETNLDENESEIKINSNRDIGNDDISYVLHKKEEVPSSKENVFSAAKSFNAEQPKIYQNVNPLNLKHHPKVNETLYAKPIIKPKISDVVLQTAAVKTPPVPQTSAVRPVQAVPHNSVPYNYGISVPITSHSTSTINNINDIKNRFHPAVSNSGSSTHSFGLPFGKAVPAHANLIQTTHTVSMSQNNPVSILPNAENQRYNNPATAFFNKNSVVKNNIVNQAQGINVYPAPEDISFRKNPYYGSDSDSDSPYKRGNLDNKVPWYLTSERSTENSTDKNYMKETLADPRLVHTNVVKSQTAPVQYSSKLGPPPPYNYKHEFNKELADNNVINKLPLTSAYSSQGSDSDSSTGSHSEQLRSLSSVLYSDGRLIGQVAPQPRVNNQPAQPTNVTNGSNPQVRIRNMNQVTPHYIPYQPTSTLNNPFNARPFMGAARSIDTILENTEESDVSSIDTRLSAADLSDRSAGSRASLIGLANHMQIQRLSDSHSGSDSSLNLSGNSSRSIGLSPREDWRSDENNIRHQPSAALNYNLIHQNIQHMTAINNPPRQDLTSNFSGYPRDYNQTGNTGNMVNISQHYGKNHSNRESFPSGTKSHPSVAFSSHNISNITQMHAFPGNNTGKQNVYSPRNPTHVPPKGILKNSGTQHQVKSHSSNNTPPTSSPRHAYSSDSDTPSQGSARSSSSLSGQNKVVRLPPSKPNGPLRMFVMDDSNSVTQKDRVFQLSKC